MEKNNKGLIITIIILVVCLIGTCGYITYDKLINKEEPKQEEKEDNKQENQDINEDNSNTIDGDDDIIYNLVYLKDKNYSDHLYWSSNNYLNQDDDDTDMSEEIENYLKSIFGNNFKGVVDYLGDRCDIFVLDKNNKLYYKNECKWSDNYETLKKDNFKQVLNDYKVTNIGFYAGPFGGYFGLGGRLAPIIEFNNEVYFLNIENGNISTTKLIDGINSENYYAIYNMPKTLYFDMSGKTHFEGLNNIIDSLTNKEIEVNIILYEFDVNNCILITEDKLYRIEGDNLEKVNNGEKIIKMDLNLSEQGTIKIQTSNNTYEYNYYKEY